MKGKYFICFFCAMFFLSFSYLNGKAQGYIKLEGKQFIDENGQPFYPMIMCYFVDLAYQGGTFDLNDTYLTRARIYGASESFDYTNVTEGPNKVLQDFYEMKNLGFNVVRLVFPAYKKSVPGFYFNVADFSLLFWQPNFLTQIDINPPYNASNTNLQFFFNKYLELATLAQTAGMKIWIDCSSSAEIMNGVAGSQQVNDYSDFLSELARFVDANDIHNLFAIEFCGEPTYGEPTFDVTPVFTTPHTKSEMCEIATQWNNAIKLNDLDNHLTTIGGVSIDDVFKGGWDPTLLPVDFINEHLYPAPEIWEWQLDRSTFLDKAYKRFRDIIYIYDKCLNKPFVIAENSFPGEDKNGGIPGNQDNPSMVFPIAVFGDETDQKNFLEQTFPLIRNTGASGYGWWDFQNKYWFGALPPNPPFSWTLTQYIDQYFGLIRYGNPDAGLLDGYETAGLRKQAADKFIDYKNNPPIMPAIPDYGPTSSIVDMNERYYNPFDHPVNNATYTDTWGNNSYGTLTGKVVDQFGKPIPRAILQGSSYVDLDIHSNAVFYPYYTFADNNGDFELRNYDYAPFTIVDLLNPVLDNIIVNLRIGSFGSDMIERGWTGGSFQIDETITIKSLQSEFEKVIDNITIPIGSTQNFKGVSTLTALNVTVEGNGTQGGVSEIKASNEVNLKPGFNVENGSEVNIIIEPVFIDCSDISDLGFRYSNSLAPNTLDLANSNPEKEVVINFYENKTEIKAYIYPNPNKGEFTLQLSGNVSEDRINKFSINDCIGNEIAQKQFNGTQTQVSFSALKPGIYFIRVQSGEQLIIQKFIVI